MSQALSDESTASPPSMHFPQLEDRDFETIPFKTICHHSDCKVIGGQRRGPQLCLENSKIITRVEVIHELGHQKLFRQVDQEE